MKILTMLAVLFCANVAAAAEIQLPAPLVFDYYSNPYCHYNPPAHTAANGFTADGNYLTGISQGYIACGHSGRGSDLHYTYYCMLDVWDLTGALVSVTVASSCPMKQIGVTWTNPVNPAYTAFTVTDVYYGYIQSQYAVLSTP